MTALELILNAAMALHAMRFEDARELKLIRDCMAKSLHMGVGESPRWN